MQSIKTYLDNCAKEYYAGTPEIPDEVFDKLADISEYRTIGAKQHAKLNKHYKQLYSLKKYYEGEGEKPLASYKNLVASPKLDGAAISLLYVKGKLVMATQRGNGVEGTEITQKMYARKDLVPLEVKGGMPDIFQVSGEIVAPKVVPNSRNYAAGALNLKDMTEFATRTICFVAYGVYPFLTGSYREDMLMLERSLDIPSVLSKELTDMFPCDGMVIRIDSNDIFDDLGYTTLFPRGAYALKERSEAVETTILSVDWQVGKSGKVTPVANLEPIYIGDKLVSRATLNNSAFIESLGIEIGDTVGVILGGEVIPCITHKA